jgi:hypothetical protein
VLDGRGISGRRRVTLNWWRGCALGNQSWRVSKWRCVGMNQSRPFRDRRLASVDYRSGNRRLIIHVREDTPSEFRWRLLRVSFRPHSTDGN